MIYKSEPNWQAVCPRCGAEYNNHPGWLISTSMNMDSPHSTCYCDKCELIWIVSLSTNEWESEQTCNRCDGSGIEHCHRCGGVGWLNYDYGKRKDCPNCASLGEHKCTRCHGDGWEQ